MLQLFLWQLTAPSYWSILCQRHWVSLCPKQTVSRLIMTVQCRLVSFFTWHEHLEWVYSVQASVCHFYVIRLSWRFSAGRKFQFFLFVFLWCLHYCNWISLKNASCTQICHIVVPHRQVIIISIVTPQGRLKSFSWVTWSPRIGESSIILVDIGISTSAISSVMNWSCVILTTTISFRWFFRR